MAMRFSDLESATARLFSAGFGKRSVAVAIVGAAFAGVAPLASAQLRLPAVSLPAPGPLGGVAAPVVDPLVERARTDLRRLRIDELLRTERRALDADRAGNPIVRGEILVLGPSESALARAAADGLEILRRDRLAGLDTELVVLSVPPTKSIHRALRHLRELDPAGTYDYNHLYLGVGGPPGTEGFNAPSAATPLVRGPGPIGLIDSGVDARHPAFNDQVIRLWGCAGTSVPDAHGTAVASLIFGRNTNLQGATLYAADVYCGRADGGAVDVIAAAFAWLTAEHVPVINVSLVGPHNVMLAAIVANVVARGALIVAAVGNDGPAAPPLYPAAYPGVIGVTGVDAHLHVLLEANRGPQVAFAAPGADLAAAAVGGGYRTVRGTSFAAPIVAGLLAAYCDKPGPDCRDGAPNELARRAVSRGRKGRDPVYGYGVVGMAASTVPEK